MKPFTLVLGSLMALLVLFEGALRIREIGQRREILAGRTVEELGTVWAEPPLLYTLRPGWKGEFNSAGFRDVERTRHKAKDVFRLAVVGDSVTMQLTIPFEKLYFRRLEADLQEELPGRHVECLAFGVTGYCADQELALMRGAVLDFAPDAMLWQFHLNDASDPVIDGANGGLGRFYARPRSQAWLYLRRKMDHYFKKRSLQREFPGLHQRDLQLQAWHWNDVGEVIFQVRELSGTREIPVWVVVYPSWPEDGDWERFTEEDLRLYEVLIERFKGAGFETLDLMPVFKRWPVSDLQRDPGDLWHPGVKGHEVMALAISRWLIERGAITLDGPQAHPF